MESMIRDFSQLLIYSRRIEEYSTLSRLVLVTVILVLAVIILQLQGLSALIGALYLFIVSLTLLVSFKSLEVAIRAVSFPLFFVVLTSIILVISYFLGWYRLDLFTIPTGTFVTLAVFLSFTCLFQFVTISEWSKILRFLGARRASILFALVLLQIPVTLIYTSEAFTTIRLKYGGKYLYKFAIPLVLLSLYTARSLAETYILYGFTRETKLTSWRSKDPLVYTISMLILAGFVAVQLLL